MMRIPTENNFSQLLQALRSQARELGFQQMGVTDVNIPGHGAHFESWLQDGLHGQMDYMARHGDMRYQPASLLEGTCRVISVRMDYLPADTAMLETLRDSSKAYISRYTLGRDYHKLIRKRLTRLGEFLSERLAEYDCRHHNYRAFVDSAPILERAFAEKAGLGWIGKNTMLINRTAGSWFFLGEIYTNAPLPVDEPYTGNHCGRCTACLDICPTNAFVGANRLDARRCISYLTIELKGSIPEELRPLMGNRIFGCDDCQLVCPWNRFAKHTGEKDFAPRHQLDDQQLVDLFLWDEATFLSRTEGSAIRRTGYENWLRNIAVALGNAKTSERIIAALKHRSVHSSPLVREHSEWALKQHRHEHHAPNT